jgi:hypothetical protein
MFKVLDSKLEDKRFIFTQYENCLLEVCDRNVEELYFMGEVAIVIEQLKIKVFFDIML